MTAWMTYVRERFPLPVYALLVGGFVLSAAAAAGSPLEVAATAFGAAGLLAFFFELRLMDELKDLEKDRVANPDRPLPRGLLNPDGVRRTVAGIALGMGAYGVALAPVAGVPAAAAFLLLTVYLWLMYREFYLGAWLVDRPILYAATHQIVLLPMSAFAALCYRPESWQTPAVWYTGLVSLGGFFAYEVCRKLDPAAHPILKTYRSMYGLGGSAALVAVSLGIAAAGAAGLGRSHALLLWPTEAILLASLPLAAHPKRFKWVEGIASISLLLHLWGGALGVWIGGKP